MLALQSKSLLKFVVKASKLPLKAIHRCGSLFSKTLITIPLIQGTTVSAQFNLDEIDNIKNHMSRYRITANDVKHPILLRSSLHEYPILSIFGQSAPGSGVIIANQGKTYYAITAYHVVKESLKEKIEIQTIDSILHSGEVIDFSTSIDAALIKFESEKFYYPAFIDPPTKASPGLKSIVSGYALGNNDINTRTLRSSRGEIIAIANNNKSGYNIIYNNATNVGMSGGGVFLRWHDELSSGANRGNEKQCGFLPIPPLVAIHGRAESYRHHGKSGANAGISILDIFREFKDELAIEGIKVIPSWQNTRLYKDACDLRKLEENKLYQK